MNRKSIINLIAVVAFGATLATGCKPATFVPGGDSQQMDKSKTILYASNFNGAYGYKWLQEAAKRYEELHKDDVYQEGKKGVQIWIDNNKDGASSLIAGMSSNRDDIFFTENAYFYDIVRSGYALDLTDIVTEKLSKYGEGFVLQYPDRYASNDMPQDMDQKKLFNTFSETDEWSKFLGIQTLGDLNESISNNRSKETILVAEALQEKKIAEIVDKIEAKGTVKMALIAGPSSSGKTTFAHRLAIQLQAAGRTPLVISLDNYYKDHGDPTYPIGEDGKPDWEALEALEIELFNKNMNDLMDGKEVELPTYDFTTGSRVYSGKKTKLNKNDIMVIEGIHGLNEKLTHKISKDKKFKIYVSALTPLSLDEHNRISTTDNRLLRRIVRDSKFRNYPAVRTLAVWDSVRLGEEKNIFPYQEEADVMFNTALVYELPILKHYAEPMLYGVPADSPYYSEAKRLIKFLSYIMGLDSEFVPPNSLLREFIGGSCFYC